MAAGRLSVQLDPLIVPGSSFPVAVAETRQSPFAGVVPLEQL